MPAEPTSKPSWQAVAMKCWLSKPGDVQNKKSCIQMQQRKAITDAQVPTYCNPASAGHHWQSTHHNDKMDPIPLTLPELCIAIHDWHTEWEPEADWDLNFNLALHQAREKRWGSADQFFKECETHACIGCHLIHGLRQLVQELCHSRGSWDKLCDMFLQIFDLLIAIVSEVKFFKVKLHEYAPLNPLSTCSDVCMYTAV
ncbi:hypothetical protein V8B97DRAFT_2022912 [Scleroderma yunnanense]